MQNTRPFRRPLCGLYWHYQLRKETAREKVLHRERKYGESFAPVDSWLWPPSDSVRRISWQGTDVSGTQCKLQCCFSGSGGQVKVSIWWLLCRVLCGDCDGTRPDWRMVVRLSGHCVMSFWWSVASSGYYQWILSKSEVNQIYGLIATRTFVASCDNYCGNDDKHWIRLCWRTNKFHNTWSSFAQVN